ncbi:MAG: glycosyltransferase [Candidatus Berkelbacteria bacterium]
MKKILYIDHSFHQKTSSTVFFRRILEDNFQVELLWDESWKGGKKISTKQINSHDCEAVVFFQVLPSISELKKINRKIIWLPMFDDVDRLPKVFWQELTTVSIKIISFCQHLTNIANEVGLDNINLQYFLNPAEYSQVLDYKTKRIFLWQRQDIGFPQLKSLFGNQEISQVILKLVADPYFKSEEPSREDIEKYNIQIIRSDTKKQQYLKLVQGCNIFISPRRSEGIGMSFLEAMSMGLAVVAFDNPTMNEYIENGKTGYLFSGKEKINLDNLEQIGKNARDKSVIGYKSWQKSIPRMIEFINSEFQLPAKYNLLWLVPKAINFVRKNVFGQLYRIKQFAKYNLRSK